MRAGVTAGGERVDSTPDRRPGTPATRPMRLRSYLHPELVVTGFRAADMHDTLRGIAHHLARAGVVPSEEAALRGLRSREEIHTTCLGGGMALPHTTVAGLSEPVILVVLADEPVPFGPDTEEPVRIFFALLSPPDREGEHIKILARICRLVRHGGFADALQRVSTADDALELIRSVDEQHV